MDARDRLESLRYLVGNTPLLAIRLRHAGRERTVYAKQESLNFTGSIKDRMALHILEDAVRSGALRPGMEITEATSGNTGISFAALGRALGHAVRIYMPDWMSERARRTRHPEPGRQRSCLVSAGGRWLPRAASTWPSDLAARNDPDDVPSSRCQFDEPGDNVQPPTRATTGPEIW